MGLNGTKIREVVIGVGINVNLKEIPSELQDKATSLYLETGKTYDRIQILAQVLECLKKIMRRLSGPAAFPEWWKNIISFWQQESACPYS